MNLLCQKKVKGRDTFQGDCDSHSALVPIPPLSTDIVHAELVQETKKLNNCK